MQQDRHWPESHSEETDVLPSVPPEPGAGAEPDATDRTQFFGGHDAPTQHFRPGNAGPAGPGDPPTQQVGPAPGAPGEQGPSRTRRWRKPSLIAAALAGFLALLYGVDLLVTNNDVPRGVSVAGVDVGGMSHHEAEEVLRSEIEPRLNQPIDYTAGAVEGKLDPEKSGLRLDWESTLEQAGEQPLNPFTRISSFFTTRELGVVTDAEPNQFDNAIQALRSKVDRNPVEGDVTFEGATPQPVQPQPGQTLREQAAKETIRSQWASGRKLDLPVKSTPVHVTAENVKATLTGIAEPAVSSSVVVRGEGTDGVLKPEEIAAGLSFKAENGALVPKLDQKKIKAGVEPELAETEQKGKDARIVFKGGEPTVEPAKEGNQINWDKTLDPLLDVLKKENTADREVTAHYEKKPPELTTKEANELGVTEVIGEFTTGGFASDSGVNIKVVAEEVNGAIVKPGETFSLNEHTGLRRKPQGYVEAGIIEDGAPSTAVGGGISQFATTLYNATYFAGLKDAGHREHSYYISRYPEAREATVFQRPDGTSVIDLKFTNDSDTGVAIQTIWTPSNITVKIWGTKRYDVESKTGERTDIKQPPTKEGPEENCTPSSGKPGFTVTDTRILKDPETGEVVRKEPQTWSYNPKAKVVCP